MGKEQKFARDDIRRYPWFTKVAIARLRNKSEEDILNKIELECLNDFDGSKAGIGYHITVNHKIVKFGGVTGGVKRGLFWYGNMTTSMGKGRFVPNIFLEEQLRKGSVVEFYGEPLEMLTRTSIDIEEPEKNIQKTDVAYFKAWEKDWQIYFKKYSIKIILNRQDNGARKDDFSKKYVQKYEERKLKYEEWKKCKEEVSGS